MIFSAESPSAEVIEIGTFQARHGSSRNGKVVAVSHHGSVGKQLINMLKIDNISLPAGMKVTERSKLFAKVCG